MQQEIYYKDMGGFITKTNVLQIFRVNKCRQSSSKDNDVTLKANRLKIQEKKWSFYWLCSTQAIIWLDEVHPTGQGNLLWLCLQIKMLITLKTLTEMPGTKSDQISKHL